MRKSWHRLFGHGKTSTMMNQHEFVMGLQRRCSCGVEWWGEPPIFTMEKVPMEAGGTLSIPHFRSLSAYPRDHRDGTGFQRQER